MSQLAQMIEDSGRGSLPRENNGLPSLNLDQMQGNAIPNDYEITGVLGDILMCEIADESTTGEVLRNGIWIKPDVTHKMWRVAQVSKMGPKCSSNIKIGDYVMYPSDKGIPMISRNSKKVIFLNEERIFAIVQPNKN